MLRKEYAISRYGVTGLNQYAIPWIEFRYRDKLFAGLGQSRSAGWKNIGQLIASHTRSVASFHLEEAANQQEEGEHRDRVVVDLAALCDRSPYAGYISATNSDRYRHIHTEVSGAKIPSGRVEEGARGIKYNRGGNNEAGPANKVLDVLLHEEGVT